MKKTLIALFLAAVSSISLMAAEAEKTADAKKAAKQPAEVAKPEIVVNQRPLWLPLLDLDVKYANNYMSDGSIVNPDQMLFGDVALTWDFGNFGFWGDIWFAWDLNDYNKESGIQDDVEEVDYTIGAWYALNAWKFTFNWTRWDYPDRTDWEQVGETKDHVDLTVSYDYKANEKWTLTPSVMVRWDYENEEWQVKPAVNSAYQFAEKWTLKHSLELFWQNARYTAGRGNLKYKDVNETVHALNHNGFTRLVLGMQLDYAINKHFSIGPFTKVAWAVSHYTREAARGSNNPNYASGINNQIGIQLHANF